MMLDPILLVWLKKNLSKILQPLLDQILEKQLKELSAQKQQTIYVAGSPGPPGPPGPPGTGEGAFTIAKTRAQLEAAKAASELVAGEIYLITDENRIAVGTAVNDYADFCKIAELDTKAPKDSPVFTGKVTINGTIPLEFSNTGFLYQNCLSSHLAFYRSNSGYGYYWRTSDDGTNAGANQATQFLLSTSNAAFYVPVCANAGTVAGSGGGLKLWGTGNIWGLYLAQAGAANSFSDGTACSGLDGSSGYAYRSRVSNASGISFIWENSSEQALMTLGAQTGNLHILGNVNVGANKTFTINNVDVISPAIISTRLNSTPINYITGRYYDQATRCTASGTIAGAAGRLDLSPMMVPVNMAVDRMGVNVTTLIASALGRCVVYSSDSLGQPSTRVLYGSSDLDFSTTGLKEHTVSFTFLAGVLYWVGLHHSSTATVSGVPIASLHSLGLSSGTATNYQTCLRQTIAYASGAPATFTFAEANITSNAIVPSIRFRAA